MRTRGFVSSATIAVQGSRPIAHDRVDNDGDVAASPMLSQLWNALSWLSAHP